MSQILCVGVKKTFCLDQSNCFGSLTQPLNWGRGRDGKKPTQSSSAEEAMRNCDCSSQGDELFLASSPLTPRGNVRGRGDPNHVNQFGNLEGP